MTDEESQLWRDEQRLPLSELERVIAAPASDGEVDDVTGNDAGAESTFGHGPEPADQVTSGEPARRRLTDEERAYRPSTTGRHGPH